MKYKAPTGHYVWYEPDITAYPNYEDYYDLESGNSKEYCGGYGLSAAMAEREHKLELERLERTKIISVYDGKGNFIGERVDTAVQRLIDKENAEYAAEQERRKKRAVHDAWLKQRHHEEFVKGNRQEELH